MFWDSSALVPLPLSEARSEEMAALLHRDAAPTIWWGSPVECQSALHRRRREGSLAAPALAESLTRLGHMGEDMDVVAPTNTVRDAAGRALAAHPLRVADALQLAAALVWASSTTGEAFVCLDDRLRDAARREGFSVLPQA